MISVRFEQEEGKITAYHITGHAAPDDEGALRCAAVSVLATATINTLSEVCGLSDRLEYEFSEGNLFARLSLAALSAAQQRDAQIVLRGFAINVADLAEQFPETIQITYEEVAP